MVKTCLHALRSCCFSLFSSPANFEAQFAEHEALVAAAELQVTNNHASASDFHDKAGSVVLLRHFGAGCVTVDYLMNFDKFNTFVADVKLAGGCFFFELEAKAFTDGGIQFGFCSEGFKAKKGHGVGDCLFSWAVDGDRQLKWHAGKNEFGSKWSVGDVIGFAIDMRDSQAAVMSISVNGSFDLPNGVAFSDISAPYLSPAFSGYGQWSVNFGDRPFAHAAPHADYVSVHAAHQVRMGQPP